MLHHEKGRGIVQEGGIVQGYVQGRAVVHGGPTTPSFFAEVSNKQRVVNIKCRSISALRRPI